VFFLLNNNVFLYQDQNTYANFILLESETTRTQYTLNQTTLEKYFKFLGEQEAKDILYNEEKEKIKIFTDGCSLTHMENKPGGWASILKKDGKNNTQLFSGSKLNSDNNYMELLGVVETLQQLDKSYYIELYSDSKYVVDGINIYLTKRIQNNFKNIKNDELRELWERYYEVIKTHTLIALWVPSSSMEELDICDKTSKQEAKKLKSKTDFNSFFGQEN
jgi:ribonuclease HI